MNITNFEGGLEADLALDADAEFVRSRHLQIGIDREYRAEIAGKRIVLSIRPRERERRRRCYYRKRRKTVIAGCRCHACGEPGITSQSIVRRADKLIIHIAQTVTATENRFAISRHKLAKEALFKIRRPGKADNRSNIVFVRFEEVMPAGVAANELIRSCRVENRGPYVAADDNRFYREAIRLTNRGEEFIPQSKIQGECR